MMTWMSDQNPLAADRAPHAHETVAVSLSPASHRDGELTIAVLASGSGTILAALAEAALPIAVVLVDRACEAENVAARAGIQIERIERTSFRADFDREGYTADVVEALAPYSVTLVAMAGYGTILGQAIHEAYPSRILNTHPALLPAFKGWHAVDEALAAGVAVTGCTVHLVTREVDAGQILAQEAVPVLPGDTVATLHERIKVVERRLYPETIRRVLSELANRPSSTPPW
jgi:phosphoribosylglycinamide formyltransferase-1